MTTVENGIMQVSTAYVEKAADIHAKLAASKTASTLNTTGSNASNGKSPQSTELTPNSAPN